MFMMIVKSQSKKSKKEVTVDRERLLQTLIKHESLELMPYRCSEGKLTIGVGHNLDDNGITEDEALYILKNDLDKCEKQLKRFLWFQNLSDVRKEVIMNLHFNIGHTSFMRFKKMILALENSDYISAAKEMQDSKWFRQVGVRAVQLVKAMTANSFF